MGTSVGAIICSLLYLNFSIEEIEKIFLEEFNLVKIFGQNIFFKLYNLIFNWGLYSSENFEKWLDTIIKKKTNISNATFKDLCFPEKDIFIFGTNINQQNPVIFSKYTTPNITLAKAITISMSIPGIITPTKIDNEYYVDGGYILSSSYKIITDPDNYLFNQIYTGQFMTENNRILLKNKFISIEKNKIINVQFDRDKLIKKIDNIIDYLQSITVCAGNYQSKTESNCNTILLDLTGTIPSEFNISLENREKLIELGYSKTSEIFI